MSGPFGRESTNRFPTVILRISRLPHVGLGHGDGGSQFGGLRRAFQSNVAAIAQVVGLLEHAIVVNLSRAWLVTARMIGQLEVADLVKALTQMTAEVAFGDLLMVEVPVDFHMGRPDLAT